MNYIELIRGFWRSHEEHSFTPTEIAVYFYLVEVCNICQWKNPFKRNNSKIGADLGISFNTLKNARNKLAQIGLIEFKTTNGSSNVLYTLSKFDKVTNEVGVKVTNEVTNEVDVKVLPTKDKLNKTETKHTLLLEKEAKGDPDFLEKELAELKAQNEELLAALNSQKEKKVAAKKESSAFKKPTLEEVKAYCFERRNLVNPEAWLDYYTSNGWRIGKSQMKDWRAAVRTWEKNGYNISSNQSNSAKKTGLGTEAPFQYGDQERAIIEHQNAVVYKGVDPNSEYF